VSPIRRVAHRPVAASLTGGSQILPSPDLFRPTVASLSAICYLLFAIFLLLPMSHSVESHLQLQVAEYDELIRRFIPRYDEMLDEVVYLVRSLAVDSGEFVELRIGTGALAERVIKAIPRAQIIGIDADPKMLEEAARRLSSHQNRIKLRLQDFFSELPAAQNAYFAALALHHIPDRSLKQTLYRKIYHALRPGGLFLNADAMFDDSNSNRERKRWAAHLVSAGFDEAEAFDHLQSWRKEDNYFGVETELELMNKAGFSHCDVAWRYGPMAVTVGKKGT
jgi:tRNA (cmo5U34)-methyltransferase